MTSRTGVHHKLYLCQICGERKPPKAMRRPEASRGGKLPLTCYSCRTSRPGFGWCTAHQEWESEGRFSTSRGVLKPFCIRASVEKRSLKQGMAPIFCPACGISKRSTEFRGGGSKHSICRSCEPLAPEGMSWCAGCSRWTLLDAFGKKAGGPRSRCRLCESAHRHGTTMRAILDLQGSDVPECAACGDRSGLLCVDHDHACCPGDWGCAQCVRGLLCAACNASEGLLRSAERAMALAMYMEKHESLRSGSIGGEEEVA